MKKLFNLLMAGVILVSGCSKQEPIEPNKPEDNFNFTIDGVMIAANTVTATLYNDYLMINTFGAYDFTMLIYLHDALPASMDRQHYSSLSLLSPGYYVSDTDGGSGSVLTFTIDETQRLAAGTFSAVLVNPDDPTDVVVISEGNFDNIKYQIAADTAQYYGESSVVMNGELSKASTIYAYDTTNSTASMYSNVNGEYDISIKNIPLTPGSYSLDMGNFEAAPGISAEVNIFDDAIYSDVQAGGTIDVVSFDPLTFTLVVNYTVSVREPGGNQVDLTEGYGKFYTGGTN